MTNQSTLLLPLFRRIHMLTFASKHVIFMLLIFGLTSCKKEPVFGPLSLKNGQEVELLVDHRWQSNEEHLLKMPEKIDAESYLIEFTEREPGFIYLVRAKYERTDPNLQDAPSSYFKFLKVISRHQSKSTEQFHVQLITGRPPGGAVIQVSKQGGNYYLNEGKIQLTVADSNVETQLEEVWQSVDVYHNLPSGQRPKWRMIEATVTHDPLKFGKAYLVHSIKFIP